MQAVLHADSNRFWSAPSLPVPRDKRLVAAGVAVASAFALTLHPATPTLEEVSQQAVHLRAFENPLAVWQQTLATTFENLGDRGGSIGSEGFPALLEGLSSPVLQAELAEAFSTLLTDPAPALTALFDRLPGWGDAVAGGIGDSATAIPEYLSGIPELLQTVAENLAAGEFFQAYYEFNLWSIYGLAAVRPLLAPFAIPGEFARDVLGAEAIGDVFDDLLTGRAAGGYVNSLISPQVAAMFQLTEILDSVRASLSAGDYETAVSDIVNIPAKVTNAFLNGMVPLEFPNDFVAGVLTEGGPIDRFFVDIPARIAAILAPAPDVEESADTAAVARVASTELAPAGDLVTISLDTPAAQVEPSTADTSSVAAEAAGAEQVSQSGDDASTGAVDPDGEPATGVVTDDEQGDDAEPSDEATDGPADEGDDATAPESTDGDDAATEGGADDTASDNGGSDRGAADKGATDKGAADKGDSGATE